MTMSLQLNKGNLIMTTQTLGIVFPGQGSQYVGMLADIAREFPDVKNIFDTASTVLDYDLWGLVQTGPAAELDNTERTQPALLAASYALWCVLKKNPNFLPAVLAGHSLGEYSALVCAGALSFTDGIRLVAMRGRFMQEAVPPGIGGLGAIVGLEVAEIEALCSQAVLPGEILAPANFNCPGQTVVAGNVQSVERVLTMAKDAGAKLVKLLPVSVPSHSQLMLPAARQLELALQDVTFEKPAIPVIGNADVKEYAGADSIRDGLVRQLYMPVRWIETIELFARMGVTQITECGPGKVLSGLNRRIAPDMQFNSTADAALLHILLVSS
jgi:[acyl-carrier-protein] S-malonyltransferase